MKKFRSIVSKLSSIVGVLIFLLIWQIITALKIVPDFLLPSPIEVLQAFINDFKLIIYHISFTLFEAFLGLTISVILGFIIAIIMDKYDFFYRGFYPIIILSQTIPTVVIAPLIVLWFGFGILPKIILVFSTCFFPITMSILTGFKSIDKDLLKLMKSFNSTYFKTLIFVKIPYSLKSFFSGLKIASSYAIIGAVVSEWLGGERGIGVYMTRVKKAFSFDKMFASIIVVSLLSIALVELIKYLERKSIYWEKN